MIEELERVVLTEDVPEEGLKAGDIGTVVLVHRGGEGYEVEFVNFEGDTIAVATLHAKSVRRLSKSDIPQARLVA